MQGRLLCTLGLSMVIVASTLAGAPSAHGDTVDSTQRVPAPPIEWSSESAPWAPDTAVINALWAAGATDDAFTGVVADPSTQSIVIYRRGGETDQRYTSLSTANLPIRIADAPLSNRDVEQLMNSIMSAGERFTALGSKLSGVLTDFKGSLSVLVSPVVPGVQDLINSLVGSAAPRVSVREASLVSTLDRFHDQPPFIAGERIVSAGGASANACTSGFTGKSATNGKAYMLTAFHCEKPGDARTWAANWPTVIGSASVLDSSHDLAYTPVSQGTVPDTWDGPVQPGLGGEFYKPVISMEHPYVNQQVCASGATSGVRCYANVTGGGWFNYTSNGTNYSAYLWSADSTTGSEMITGGDSGGPVFRPVGNTVVATGVIHGFIDGFTVSCSTVYFYDVTPTDCSNNVTFADVYTEAYINHDINLTLQAP